jgi:FkbH-like protein
MEALVEARALSRIGWDEANLRSLGRRVRKVLGAEGVSASDLRSEGLTALRVLFLSPNTASHMADVLIATAIRFGFLLELQIAEYDEPQSWLDRNRAQLEERPPDYVILAMDRKSMPAPSPLGDEQAAEASVAAALGRTLHIADHVRGMIGRPVMLQTLAADPDMPQTNSDLGLAGAPRQLVSEFNRRLANVAREQSHLLLDVAGISSLVGQAAWSAGRYWYVAKYPFAADMAPLYADHLMRILAAQAGRSRRVLVLDLDNTLWGGVVGDDGVDGLDLGSGSPLGEVYSAIQRMALAYRERGIILCVSSKNDEAIALEVFRRHPEMVIKEDDVVVFRINWQDKAANISAIAQMLDLGLESFVLLDDNPAERKRVRDALPMVAVPELPADPAGWIPVVQAAGFFEHAAFSHEDRQRGDFYKANLRRAEQMKKIGDHDDYLRSLQMTLTIAPFDAVGRKRIAQLIAKSNQFNLTTRRYGEAEVAALQADPDRVTVQARLEDVFGDNGMISTVVCRRRDRLWEVESWIMSCRVLGRRVEEAILQHLVKRARAAGVTEIFGHYIPTSKNALVSDHYSKLGFRPAGGDADGSTKWSLLVDGYSDKELPMAIRILESAPILAEGTSGELRAEADDFLINALAEAPGEIERGK